MTRRIQELPAGFQLAPFENDPEDGASRRIRSVLGNHHLQIHIAQCSLASRHQPPGEFQRITRLRFPGLDVGEVPERPAQGAEVPPT